MNDITLANRMLMAAIALGLAAGCGTNAAGTEQKTDVAAQPEALDGVTIDGCDVEQANRIRSATDDALAAILDGLNDLESVANGGDTSRVDYWFGSHDDELLGDVYTVVQSMYTNVHIADYACNCPDEGAGLVAECTANRVDLPLYLCNAWFSGDYHEVSVGGILHELSHLGGTGHYFPCPIGTSDWPDQLHDYAVELPSWAVNNAESYRLYLLGWHPGQQSSFTCGID
jgi:hypothetical protein